MRCTGDRGVVGRCQKDGREVAPIERDKQEKKKWLTESERRKEEEKD